MAGERDGISLALREFIRGRGKIGRELWAMDMNE